MTALTFGQCEAVVSIEQRLAIFSLKPGEACIEDKHCIVRIEALQDARAITSTFSHTDRISNAELFL